MSSDMVIEAGIDKIAADGGGFGAAMVLGFAIREQLEIMIMIMEEQLGL